MLYITTRDWRDAYTSARTLSQDRADDGGAFVPFRLPVFQPKEIRELSGLSFGQITAEILNLFFSSKLTGLDVDFAIGKNPVKLQTVNHRLFVAELWHNPSGEYRYLEETLFKRICPDLSRKPTLWFRTVVRIAVLFGIYPELMRADSYEPEKSLDVAVSAEDFSAVMAAWYARKMGLPVSVIVCGCNTDSGLWDLITRGAYGYTEENRSRCEAYEELIQATLGSDEGCRFHNKCLAGRSYSISEEMLQKLNSGLFASVVGDSRISAVRVSVKRAGQPSMDTQYAIAYAALQDYRAGNSESRGALILADRGTAV